MPLAYQPVYEDWKTEFERYTVGKESILVGYSCGAGFLLRWLSENPIVIKRLVLVAAWLDPQSLICPEFFDFTIDPALSNRADLQMITSDNDRTDIFESAELIRQALPAINFRLFPGYGHFRFSDLGTGEFPELRDIVLSGDGD